MISYEGTVELAMPSSSYSSNKYAVPTIHCKPDRASEHHHGDELEGLFVDRTPAEMPVQIRKRDGNDLPIVAKVVHDLVRPLADLRAPVLVDTGGAAGEFVPVPVEEEAVDD